MSDNTDYDYPAMAELPAPCPVTATSPDIVIRLEEAAEIMQMGVGRWRLIVEFRDGRYQWCEPTPIKMGADALRRYDSIPPQS